MRKINKYYFYIFLIICSFLFYSCFCGSSKEELNSKLFEATKTGKLEKVKDLLSDGADPNASLEDGSPVLAFAVGKGHIEIVKTLLDNGADPKKENNTGWTALHLARNPEILKLLIKKGADINAETKEGLTPLGIAIADDKLRKEKIPVFLLNLGANPKIGNPFGYGSIFELAVTINQIEIVKRILDKEHNGETKEGLGNPMIHFAAINNFHELVKLFIENGTDPNLLESKTGDTPLIRVAGCLPIEQGEKIETIKYLLSKGANPNIKNKEGKSALYEAAYGCCLNQIKLLLSNGAKKDKKLCSNVCAYRNKNKKTILKLLGCF